MNQINALYIDDDHSNLKTYGTWLTDLGVQLHVLPELPEDISNYLSVIENNKINVLIVDDYFEKQGMQYTGADIIKYIRAFNQEIYILFFVIDTRHQPSALINRILYRSDFMRDINEIIVEVQHHINDHV